MPINLKPIQDKNYLVSIVYALEGDLQIAINVFKNLRQQSYKNVEYIFVYNEKFQIEEFKIAIFDKTDLDLTIPTQFVLSNVGVAMIDDGIAVANGDIIFLKSTAPVIWYKHHILVHLEKHRFAKDKQSIVLSLIETKNLFKSENDASGTLGYRISKKIQPNDLILDEISFTKDVKLKISDCSMSVNDQGQEVENGVIGSRSIFNAKKLYNKLTTLGKIQFTDEISVVLFVPFQEQQTDQNNIQLTQPDWSQINTIQEVRDDEDFTIRNFIPTVFGNAQLDKGWNDEMKKFISKYWSEIIKEENKNVIIKRTIGMGDVIQVEPVIRFFKKLGFTTWFVTGNSRGANQIVNYFESQPDHVLEIPETELAKDILGQNNLKELLKQNNVNPDTQFDLRIDLDLSYESHFDIHFVKAYFNVFGTDEMKLDEYIKENEDALTPKLSKIIQPGGLDFEKNYINKISVNLDGSGWQGKCINKEDAYKILLEIKNKGYKLVHTSTFPTQQYDNCKELFDEINESNDFKIMIDMIEESEAYVGADNGTMHIALSYNKPILVWNGSALTEITTQHYNKELYTILKKPLECIGCKHKQFFNIINVGNGQKSLTFLPQCTNVNQYECMSTFPDDLLNNTIQEFINKIN